MDAEATLLEAIRRHRDTLYDGGRAVFMRGEHRSGPLDGLARMAIPGLRRAGLDVARDLSPSNIAGSSDPGS